MDTPRRHRACNACRSRKVRCNPGADQQQRCRECEHLNLRCEYPAPAPRRKRNARGEIIQSHRHSFYGANGGEEVPLRQLKSNGDVASPGQMGILSPLSPITQPPDDDINFFIAVLRDYDAWVYPFLPIITTAEARDAIATMHYDREARAFVYAVCAATISLAHSLTAPEDEPAVITRWLEKSTDASPGILTLENITVRRTVLAELTSMALVGLGQFEPAHHYLRQAISMVDAQRLGDANKLLEFPPAERARRQRLYWLLFIHERYFALSHHHVISMVPMDWMPEFDESIPPQITHGFNQIISLFRHIDAEMIDAWLAVTDETATVSAAWIQAKHRELEAEPAGYAEHIGNLWGSQQADLIITKHWMRMLLWQIALSRQLLSSGSDEQSMSLLFPVGVSSQLRGLIGRMSRREVSIHGSGIQQKLFELTDIIASVVLTLPNVDRAETIQRIDDFRFLFDFWRMLPRLNATQLGILQDKDEKIKRLAI